MSQPLLNIFEWDGPTHLPYFFHTISSRTGMYTSLKSLKVCTEWDDEEDEDGNTHIESLPNSVSLASFIALDSVKLDVDHLSSTHIKALHLDHIPNLTKLHIECYDIDLIQQQHPDGHGNNKQQYQHHAALKSFHNTSL